MTLAVVTVLLLAAAVGGGVVVWQQRSDDGASAGRDPVTASTGDPATPDPDAPTSPTPPPAPTPPASTSPDSPVAPEPTDGFDRDPLPSPEPPSVPELSSKPLSYREFAHDWDYRMGDVALQATFEDGTDHDGCGPAENDGALTGLGCVDAVEWTYRALGGDLALSHLVLTMRSREAATRAVDRDLITEESWRLRPSSYLDGSPGSWKVSAVGQFLVLTVETHRPSVKAARASTFLLNANLDIRGALAFRF
ncbi:hypothetical protein [Nocardioides rubriscoriae]|uniref:hypothetical protein n=1 Tax=Nocardioides rubriscoriae TaxID=642762 RepID=UPI0011DFEC17|nr:hypothetical protein [Nocardioides rubriscoriae]